MKTLLVGINAKYIHSNIAIRYLKKYTEQKLDLKIDLCEYTINNHIDLIIREIVKQSPDVLGFSCYIWNYELVKKLVCELKKIIPQTIIFLGGPEVSYDSQTVLEDTGCNAVISGEGEGVFCEFVDRISNGIDFSDIEGITALRDGDIVKNPPSKPISLDEIPFVYDDYEELENRIIYYESSRGCPFRCQYCLSSSSGGVRFLSLERVFADLKNFLDAGVSQVKFVDRTFNCDKKYAMQIWRFLDENDNGKTNFHFEIAAELLDQEMLELLQTVRRGLFQLEIGVQSTNPQTLKAVKRNTDTQKLTPIIKALQKNSNMHLHLDLIVGLPFEPYETFKNSFNYVYSLSPDQLQIGFLKLLKGSGLYENAEDYGIITTTYAPYEVLKTNWLTYSEILRLKMIEEMVESYYNSNRYKLIIKYISSFFETAFDMFESLADFYEKNNLHLAPHSKVGYYTILFDFFKTISTQTESFKWYAIFDLYSHEKAKKIPEWIDVSNKEKYKKEIYDFADNPENVLKYLSQYKDFDTKQILRSAHIEVFDFNPITDEKTTTAILFNYKECDSLGNAGTKIIDLSSENSAD